MWLNVIILFGSKAQIKILLTTFLCLIKENFRFIIIAIYITNIIEFPRGIIEININTKAKIYIKYKMQKPSASGDPFQICTKRRVVLWTNITPKTLFEETFCISTFSRHSVRFYFCVDIIGLSIEW